MELLSTAQIPLYIRAKQALLAYIRDGLRTGAFSDNKLPAEEILCQMFGVSRPTLREALMALARDGVISKKHGTGNLIHRSTLDVRMRFDKFSDFRILLEEDGATVDLESSPFLPATEEAMRELIAAGGGSAVCLFQENLYIVDKTPVLLVYNYPHCSMSALRDVNRDASDGSFASFLTAISGEDSAHTIVRVQPALASDRVADRLELPAGMPLLRLKEEHYSVFDRLLGESVVFFHPRRTAPAILRKW